MKQQGKKLAALLAALCVTALLFAACGTGEQSSGAPQNPSSQAQESAPEADGPVPGVTEENYPRVDGSTANLPMLAKMYSEICNVPLEDAQQIVEVSGGTGAVWRRMLDGNSDLLVVYEAPENLKEQLEASEQEYLIDPVGRDGLVFLMNENNPVDDLSVKQLQDIYAGVITDWGDVGGTPGPIAAFQRNEESGSQTLFLKLLMPGITPMEPPKEYLEMGMGGLLESVSAFSGEGDAIGFSVYYYASLMYSVPNLKLISVDGVQPSFESIKSKEYPLTNDFYVVIRADEPEGSPARLMRDWLLSEDGARMMKEMDYVPVN